jgi:hypothetical protein
MVSLCRLLGEFLSPFISPSERCEIPAFYWPFHLHSRFFRRCNIWLLESKPKLAVGVVSVFGRSQFRFSYLLTELSPSWEAAICAATQELPSILRNPKVHHRVHKSPPLVPILRQIDPVHTISSCLSNIYFNIVHRFSSWTQISWLEFLLYLLIWGGGRVVA